MVDAFDYLESRDDADELIQEFAPTLKALRRVIAGGTDPGEPVLTPTDYPTFIAVVDYTDRQIDGENILRTDKRALVAAGPLSRLGITTVLQSDVLVMDGQPIQIVRVKPLRPDATTVFFDCQVRF